MGYRRVSGFGCPSEHGPIVTEESEVSNNIFPEGRMGQQFLELLFLQGNSHGPAFVHNLYSTEP